MLNIVLKNLLAQSQDIIVEQSGVRFINETHRRELQYKNDLQDQGVVLSVCMEFQGHASQMH